MSDDVARKAAKRAFGKRNQWREDRSATLEARVNLSHNLVQNDSSPIGGRGNGSLCLIIAAVRSGAGFHHVQH